MQYVLTVGLEVHAELKTKSKMFCGCRNNPDEKKPNVNVCPVCMGHPGTLPVINKEAVRHVLKVGLALGGTVADFTEFDRKNYFYPDIPKGYQISQYKYPLVQGGSLRGVGITRVHLEEDTATSKHDQGEYSLVDFNRAGVPLMELVTEPVIHSPEEASAFAEELQLLLRTLGVGDANMEKGEMRVEANISIALEGSTTFGTKVEVKNLNSFKSVERAIAYEMKRHADVLSRGEKVVQETRGWDEDKGVTYSQRLKENAHDYRYFPDPDLPKLKISECSDCSHDVLKKEMPALPWEKRKMYGDMGIKKEDVEVFVRNPIVASLFEGTAATVDASVSKQKIANYITTDLMGLMKQNDFSLNEEWVNMNTFAELMNMLEKGELSSRGAKDTLAILYTQGGSPKDIAEKNGWIQKNDPEALQKMLTTVIEAHPQAVMEYKSGKESSIQFLIGQVMKASKGSFNPTVIKTALEALLK